jgi:hypothetical protein
MVGNFENSCLFSLCDEDEREEDGEDEFEDFALLFVAVLLPLFVSVDLLRLNICCC